MQRILDPAQIEAFAERSIPRIRLPDPVSLFARRAQRLRKLAEGYWSRGGVPSGGDSLGDYLRLMAVLADGQQVALDAVRVALASQGFADQLGRQIELAHEHRMPLLQAA